MFGLFDKIEQFFRDMLLGGIQANLESMFLDIKVNVKVDNFLRKFILEGGFDVNLD